MEEGYMHQTAQNMQADAGERVMVCTVPRLNSELYCTRDCGHSTDKGYMLQRRSL